MLKAILAVGMGVWNELRKLRKWIRNPTNGKGQYVTPWNRRYLSTGMTLVAILSYRLGEGLYNLGMSIIFDLLAPLLNAVIGICSDLWHANPSYSRWAGRIALSGIVSAGKVAIVVAKTVGAIVATLFIGLFR